MDSGIKSPEQLPDFSKTMATPYHFLPIPLGKFAKEKITMVIFTIPYKLEKAGSSMSWKFLTVL
jgi:hypothetical protein